MKFGVDKKVNSRIIRSMMKKKIYLSVDWDSRSISVSSKKEWEEYKEYLKEEKKCGEYEDGDSFEIYNEGDEESGDGMVELKIKVKDLY